MQKSYFQFMLFFNVIHIFNLFIRHCVPQMRAHKSISVSVYAKLVRMYEISNVCLFFLCMQALSKFKHYR